MLRHLVVSVLVLLAIDQVQAQERVDQRADSVMRERDELFEDLERDTGSTRTLMPPTDIPASTWAPEFSPSFSRRDLLGLRTNNFYATYDRADGLTLRAGADLPAAILLSDARLQGYLSVGYSFGSHYWQARGGLRRDLFDAERPTRIGGEAHFETDTRDGWKMDAIENTLYAAIAGGDSRDYFQRRGFSIAVEQFFAPRVSASIEYRDDDYRSSRREAGWSIFGPPQPFREVPLVRHGRMRSVAVRFSADFLTLRSAEVPTFSLAFEVEAGPGDPGERLPAFNSVVADIRLKLPLIERLLRVALRGRVGASTGSAPPQRHFSIGGAGSLPGYPQNEYVGNTMLLVQSDVVLQATRTGLLRHIRLMFSNDVAAIYRAHDASNTFTLPVPTTADLKYSPGVYLGSPDSRIRIGVAWRTDISSPPNLVVRVNQVF